MSKLRCNRIITNIMKTKDPELTLDEALEKLYNETGIDYSRFGG